MLKSLRIANLLSFGPDSQPLDLLPLNVLIGPNGSGKSNVIDAISILKAAPRDLFQPVRNGGGIDDWIWKDDRLGKMAALRMATVESVIEDTFRPSLRYRVSVAESSGHAFVDDERLEHESPEAGDSEPKIFCEHTDDGVVLTVAGENSSLQKNTDSSLSILSQRKDPNRYPELWWVGRQFDAIRIYRDWTMGRYSSPRLRQGADMRTEFLEEDASNLGLVLNRLRRNPDAKRAVLENLREFSGDFDDFDVSIVANTVQVFLTEGRFTVPATRLSDGTLRYLCLLAILCHPEPPPLVCIEEPEMGLHPDILPTIAKLLRAASERTQLIVTTHSDILVDALSDTPEAVVACEKGEGGTTLRRLDKDQLAPWLKDYRLGQLWLKGKIGATRW